MKYTIKVYETHRKKAPFEDWLDELETNIQSKMLARLKRVSVGGLGILEPVGDGVYEFKIDSGPGYRMYYTIIGRTIILLLAGGTKRTQKRDIAKAKEYSVDFKASGGKNAKNKIF